MTQQWKQIVFNLIILGLRPLLCFYQIPVYLTHSMHNMLMFQCLVCKDLVPSNRVYVRIYSQPVFTVHFTIYLLCHLLFIHTLTVCEYTYTTLYTVNIILYIYCSSAVLFIIFVVGGSVLLQRSVIFLTCPVISLKRITSSINMDTNQNQGSVWHTITHWTVHVCYMYTCSQS